MIHKIQKIIHKMFPRVKKKTLKSTGSSHFRRRLLGFAGHGSNFFNQSLKIPFTFHFGASATSFAKKADLVGIHSISVRRSARLFREDCIFNISWYFSGDIHDYEQNMENKVLALHTVVLV